MRDRARSPRHRRPTSKDCGKPASGNRAPAGNAVASPQPGRLLAHHPRPADPTKQPKGGRLQTAGQGHPNATAGRLSVWRRARGLKQGPGCGLSYRTPLAGVPQPPHASHANSGEGGMGPPPSEGRPFQPGGKGSITRAGWIYTLRGRPQLPPGEQVARLGRSPEPALLPGNAVGVGANSNPRHNSGWHLL